ncbi:PilZ domain-containing protein [Tautonia sp. JC769]|uniref:PilZ domain-containing protein n=1 Tax=Tautonia sp. JC769 TaxID=3232135 RepID=UPI003457B517
MSKLRHFADFVVDHQQFDNLADRRQRVRHASNGNECWIGWWQEGTWRLVSAALRDISQGGAGLRVRLSPPPRSAIWFRPKDVGQDAWIEGTIVRVSRPGLIRFVMGCPTDIGLYFREECPWETLRAALFGLGTPRKEESVVAPPSPRLGGTPS